MPMYQRARHGLGYLPQEHSIFTKMNTLEKLHDCMERLQPRVELSPAIIERARLPIDRAVISKGWAAPIRASSERWRRLPFRSRS